MVQQIVGIDFGTTNSLISVVTHDGRIKSYADRNRPHPSVIRYETDKIICGQKAKDQLEHLGVGVLGNTVRGPKKLLNKDAINVGGRLLHPTTVVSDFMKYLKEHALSEQQENEADLTKAVVTIPVELDGKGRMVLREAMLNSGIYVERFVHEPLAALYGYFKDLENTEDELRRNEGRMILVFDWGGGTLDLTLCQVLNGAIVQIQNMGNNTVGGDYLDEAILSFVEKAHAKQYGWTADSALQRYPGMRGKLLADCEKAKIILSNKEKANIFVPDYFQGSGDATEIDVWLTREDLEQICSKLINKGIGEIEHLLSPQQTNIDSQTISLCLATGGMINMPSIKQQLAEIFGPTVLHISSKGDRIISEGAARIAADELELSLAKPFELLEARNSVVTLWPEGTTLPSRGYSIATKQSMYSTDPRDSKALIAFKRPLMVGKSGASDTRVTYGNMSVPINSAFPPFGERILVEATIDDNLIVHVSAVGCDEGEMVKMDFYELEFALRLLKKNIQENTTRLTEKHKFTPGVVALSNISKSKDAWDLVPGELLQEYNESHPYNPKELTEQQRLEHLRYQPCARCGAKWAKNCCNVN